MNVLVVDDRPNLVRITAIALRLHGCLPFGAHTSVEALQVLSTEKIDAVFLDVNLSGESGLDLLSTLSARPGSPPVVMFTAHAKDEVATEAMARGAFDCLVKPFTSDELRQQLGRLAQHTLPAPGPASDPLSLP